MARPKGAKDKLPAVLVVHENRGLNPHIEDVARRLALAGYRAFAPDALFTLGGYPGDEDSARALFPQLDQAKCREDFVDTLVTEAKRRMQGAVELRVPLTVDAGVGDNWDQAH